MPKPRPLRIDDPGENVVPFRSGWSRQPTQRSMPQSPISLVDLIAAHPASSEVWQADLVPADRVLGGLGAGGGSDPSPRSIHTEQPHFPLWVVNGPSPSLINEPVPCDAANVDVLIDEMRTIFADPAMARPRRIEVARRDVFDALNDALDGVGVEVVLVAQLQAIDATIEQLSEVVASEAMADGPLDGRGVTAPRYARFCDAAAEFWRAAPWGELTPMDVIVVERPKPPKGMACIRVASRVGPPIRVAFFGSQEAAWEGNEIGSSQGGATRWLFGFGLPEDLPPGDGVAFDDNWPCAAPDAHPWLVCLEPDADALTLARPDAKRLAFVEGLLRAIARTTPEQMDAGRWTIDVETADGRREYSLALPDLIDPPDHTVWYERGAPHDPRWVETSHFVAGQLINRHRPASVEETRELLRRELGTVPDTHRFEPASAAEAAQALCYDAVDVYGRRRIQLARRALEKSPTCVDAMVLLSEHAASRTEALGWLDRAVEAGRVALDPERLRRPEGFWMDLSTRPYMRALLARGETLDALDQLEPALECYRELLRLNPDDNQGVRELYLPLLLKEGRLKESLAFMRSRPEDGLAVGRYARAIAEYLEGGDTQAARRARRAAIKANPHIAAILADPDVDFDEDDVESPAGTVRVGGVDEAEACAPCFAELVEATPELADWFEEGLGDGEAPVQRSGGESRRAGFKMRKRKSR